MSTDKGPEQNSLDDETVDKIIRVLRKEGFNLEKRDDGTGVYRKGNDVFYVGYEQGEPRLYFDQGIAPLIDDLLE